MKGARVAAARRAVGGGPGGAPPAPLDRAVAEQYLEFVDVLGFRVVKRAEGCQRDRIDRGPELRLAGADQRAVERALGQGHVGDVGRAEEGPDARVDRQRGRGGLDADARIVRRAGVDRDVGRGRDRGAGSAGVWNRSGQGRGAERTRVQPERGDAAGGRGHGALADIGRGRRGRDQAHARGRDLQRHLDAVAHRRVIGVVDPHGDAHKRIGRAAGARGLHRDLQSVGREGAAAVATAASAATGQQDAGKHNVQRLGQGSHVESPIL